MFESLTITGTLWYQFVDRTSSLTFVSGLYIIIIGSSVGLLELSVLEVLDKPITQDKTTPHAKLYISFKYVYTASMNVCIANPRVIRNCPDF